MSFRVNHDKATVTIIHRSDCLTLERAKFDKGANGGWSELFDDYREARAYAKSKAGARVKDCETCLG